MSADHHIAYVAHRDDLYRVVFDSGGNISDVILYLDSDLCNGNDLSWWSLPLVIRERIQKKIDELLV